MKTVSNYVSKIMNFITTIIIILLSICVISSFQTTFFGKKYNSFFGYSLFEIKTASMSGQMEIGDWILVKITDDVELNDIITFEQDGTFVTHRIIEHYKDTYITKGDSNNSKDTPINKSQIVGKMVRVMPKFGIIKKTFFNPKVLVILMVTIIVGSSLFDKKNNAGNVKPVKTKVIKKEPEKIDFDFETIDDKTILTEEIIEKIETKIKEKNTEVKKAEVKVKEEFEEETDLMNNTMVLSKIVVDMNSKTLETLSKHLEDTVPIETQVVPVVEKKEVAAEPQTFTGKKVLLGKNEKNIIKKGIELKENEIVELIKVLLNKEELNGELHSIVNKFLDIYIETKYINQGDLEENTTLVMFRKSVNESILSFSEILVKGKNNDSYKNKVTDVANAFLLINKIDNNKDDIENVVLSDKNFNFVDEKKVLREIKKIRKQFNSNLSAFFQKLESKKFTLMINNVFKGKIFKTNISSNIQFNKLFSQYSIEETYHSEVIAEDLRELQLKMLSLVVLEDMFEFSYKKKYLINFNDSLFKKIKKLKGFLGNIDDTYSQGKINILVDAKTLLLNFNTISDLNKEGYKFAIEISYDDLVESKDIRKYLYVADTLIIINKNVDKENIMEYIPLELENKIVSVDKSIIEGPVIK